MLLCFSIKPTRVSHKECHECGNTFDGLLVHCLQNNVIFEYIRNSNMKLNEYEIFEYSKKWSFTGGSTQEAPLARFPCGLLCDHSQNTKFQKVVKSWFKSDVISANLNQYQIPHLLSPNTLNYFKAAMIFRFGQSDVTLSIFW